jgi:hypothetical protein
MLASKYCSYDGLRSHGQDMQNANAAVRSGADLGKIIFRGNKKVGNYDTLSTSESVDNVSGIIY